MHSIGEEKDGSESLDSVTVATRHVRATSGPAFFWAVHRALRRSALQHGKRLPRIVHASDLYSLAAARTVAHRTGAALTYDARELYPHVAATVGRPWISAFWKQLESRLIRSCAAVFTVNHSIADRIAEQYAVPRPTVVENVPRYRPVQPTNRLQSVIGLPDDCPIVLHQGHIKTGRGCELLVRAAPAVPDTHFVFLGDGPLRPTLHDLTSELAIQDRVHFIDPVPPEHLLDYTASATVGATLLEDTCLNHHLALPNKLFEYLMAGTPVLASNLPEINRIVSNFQVGRLVEPGSTRDIGSNLKAMLAAPGELAAYRQNTHRVFETINWQSASERFLNEFRRLRQTLP